MKIAIAGCCGGELDRVYEAVKRVQDKNDITLDLLICCGNFEAVRDEEDLETLNSKWKRMKDFHKYYTGEKTAPVLTVFVGGMYESPGFLRELYYGGWVAPNIYYLGYANVVRLGNLRIAGLSGTFKGQDYFKGHYEFPPYTESTLRSCYAVREWDVRRLECLAEPVDVVVSHDWPRGIWKHGDHKELLAREGLDSDAKREMEGGSYGSPAAMELLQALRPGFWFAGKLHQKFAALVPHKDGTFTRFLGLAKCESQQEFLQVVDIDPKSQSFMRSLTASGAPWQRKWGRSNPNRQSSTTLDYDPEWLAMQKVNHRSISFSCKTEKAMLKKPTKEDVSWVLGRLRAVVGSRPRLPDESRRHDMLLPVTLREGGGKGGFKDLSTAQLRELFESRGLDFPGHLDKASLVRQLEEHDEFFAAERHARREADSEAFAIKANSFKAERENAAEQRRAMLALLDLEDYWAQQEAELKKQQKQQDPDYDPFSEAFMSDVNNINARAGGDDGAGDDEESDVEGAGAAVLPPKVDNDGAGDDEDDLPTLGLATATANEDGAGDDEDDLPTVGLAAATANEEAKEDVAAEDAQDAGDALQEDAYGDAVGDDPYAMGEVDMAETDPYAALLAEAEAADAEDAAAEAEAAGEDEGEPAEKLRRLA